MRLALQAQSINFNTSITFTNTYRQHTPTLADTMTGGWMEGQKNHHQATAANLRLCFTVRVKSTYHAYSNTMYAKKF